MNKDPVEVPADFPAPKREPVVIPAPAPKQPKKVPAKA